MRKMKLFAAAVALMGMSAMVSCSNEEPVNNGTGSESSQGDSYIHVNICNVPDAGTRAGDNAGFNEGTEEERAIGSIAFYFFHADGTPFLMESSSNNITGTTSNPASNRVKPVINDLGDKNQYSATLVLGKAVNEGWKGTVPARMIAIANSMKTTDPYINKNMDDLLTTLYAETPEDFGENNFVMTSSTYSSNGTIKFWSDITLDNVKKTPADAIGAPVNIYLERLAAKVSVYNNPKEGAYYEGDKTIFKVATRPIYDKDGKQVTKTFYAKILGWDLNATVNKSYVFKNVDSQNVPFTNWNLETSFRSCWAKTPSDVTLSKSFKWEDLTADFGDVLYCYENTLNPTIARTQDAATDATKVLLKAEIRALNAEGKLVRQNLISWAGTLYSESDFKIMVANHIGNGCTAEDIVFKRCESPKIHVVNTYYKKIDENNQEVEIPVDEFNNIRVWRNGICYYIVNIRHTLDDQNKNVYGVVRNHSYQISINSITGLGTPGGPGDHPTPENPDPEEESFVSAQVNVLNWHVISWDVDVES